MKKPQTLSEAIERLEEKGQDSVQDFKEILSRDYGHLLKTLEELKLKDEADRLKTEVQKKAEENPLLTLGVVGVFFFFLGWIFGSRKK